MKYLKIIMLLFSISFYSCLDEPCMCPLKIYPELKLASPKLDSLYTIGDTIEISGLVNHSVKFLSFKLEIVEERSPYKVYYSKSEEVNDSIYVFKDFFDSNNVDTTITKNCRMEFTINTDTVRSVLYFSTFSFR